MSKRWRVYCTEPGDEGWKYIWSDTAPTECPNDSGHSINVNSIRQDKKEVPLYKFKPHTRRSKSKHLEEIAICGFDPSVYRGELRRVKLLGHVDTGSTSYDFEVYDRANNTTLVISNFSNTEVESDLVSTGVISSPPISETVLEFNVRRNGGGGKKYIWVEEICLCFAVDY